MVRCVANSSSRRKEKPNMLDRFTLRAQRIFTLARKEAERLGDDTIGTDHMVLLLEIGDNMRCGTCRFEREKR